MIPDIVEGALDKTESGLRAILSAQARVRAVIALPVVIVEALLYLTSPEGVASRLLALTLGYCAYVVAMHVLVHHRKSVPAHYLLVASAVLDPLALSAWLVVIGEYGSIMVGFYLFTILGFGFRTGRPLMHLCQLTTIASFLLVFLSVPYWQANPTVWVALMLPLVVVPMYAGALIKTLRESREHAERESQAKSALLAKVSHELRTPLTGIITATELLAAEVGYETVTRRTDTILTLSNELLREINELLDVAKFGARAAELHLAPFDLAEKMQMVHDALAPTAAKKGTSFCVALDPAIVDWIDTDAHYLGRVMLNLAGNAVKFTERGQVNVAVDLLEETPLEYRLRFSVEDTGIGIPESFHDSIFQPFAQVEQGAGRRFGGTGLGLAFSRQIVELMGSELLFESKQGKGSRFWFDVTLPRSRAADAEVESAPTPAVQQIVSGLRILVAEDNETNLMLLHELLVGDGHEVTTCASGMAALDALAEQDFDLLLLDYNLGDMDGVRLLQTYRFGRIDAAPAMFLTADTSQQTAIRLRECGAAGVMYKPITLARLRMAIRDLGKAVDTGEGFAVSDPTPPVDAGPRQSRPVLTAIVASPIDASVIEELKLVSNRPEFFPNLLLEACSDIQRNVGQISVALAERHYAAVRDAAHALKGVSGDVGAVRLVALAGNLMAATREELENAHVRWSADLAEATRATVTALQKELPEGTVALSVDAPSSLHLD
ncbi:ATP-binding protein [Dokdonella immobilis]|uniref:histidine kinase n=1 Tax=Dokdonella immobilis TaxID=578942 RepID=A0A1I4ZLX6_9GAMM|nr:ATP-binding protein [Dokdonella immobilis]SFN51254.1 two-component system, sensor histidine kinase RpfC [Dokdonella immobilis]